MRNAIILIMLNVSAACMADVDGLRLESGVSTSHAQKAELETLIAIPADLSSDFKAQVLDRAHAPERRMALLANYLLSPNGLHIQYDSEATHSVQDVFQTRRANCLSFTLVTLALAKLAGLDAYPQDIPDAYYWNMSDATAMRVTHVNAGIRIRGRRYSIDVASDQVISSNRPRAISEARLASMYVNNVAAQTMEAGHLALAQSQFEHAIRLDPTHAGAWNNFGVLSTRLKLAKQAQTQFETALALEPNNRSAIKNLSATYLRTEQTDLVQSLAKRLDNLQKRDPFYHFLRGLKSERQKDYWSASKHFRAALRLYKLEHRFHFALARSEFRLQQLNNAYEALTAAIKLSVGRDKSMYQQKLSALRHMH
jgi:tetratricopeptide (TPR) repeat protein